jgi:hypothetical protein
MPTEIIVIALTNKVSELTEKLEGLLLVVEKLTLESLKKSKSNGGVSEITKRLGDLSLLVNGLNLESLKKSKSKGDPSIGNDEIKDMIKKEVTKGYINKLYGKNK